MPVAGTCVSHYLQAGAVFIPLPPSGEDVVLTVHSYKSALIVGAGAGLSASLTRLFAKEGISVSIAARNRDKLAGLCRETGATAYGCDASDRAGVEQLFSDLDAASATPDVVVYNPSFRTRGAFIELDPDDVEKVIAITAYGAFLVAQQAAKRMVRVRRGPYSSRARRPA